MILSRGSTRNFPGKMAQTALKAALWREPAKSNSSDSFMKRESIAYLSASPTNDETTGMTTALMIKAAWKYIIIKYADGYIEVDRLITSWRQ